MIVTLKGMPDGKDLAYETGVHYFVDHVKLRIAEHEPPRVTPSNGEKPDNFMPMEREITFCFSHNVGGHSIYSAVPNVQIEARRAVAPSLSNAGLDNFLQRR